MYSVKVFDVSDNVWFEIATTTSEDEAETIISDLMEEDPGCGVRRGLPRERYKITAWKRKGMVVVKVSPGAPFHNPQTHHQFVVRELDGSIEWLNPIEGVWSPMNDSLLDEVQWGDVPSWYRSLYPVTEV